MADVDAICPDWQVEEPLDPTAEWSLRCDELGAGIQLSLGSLEYGRSVEEARQQFAAIVDHPDNPDYRCSAEGFFGAAIVMGGNWFAVADDSVAAQIALATGGYLEPAANCPG